MNKYDYLNTGNVIKLETLVKSTDVTDETIIQIFDNDGNFVTKGNWFQDNILEYAAVKGVKGVANKPGTGHTVNFRMSNETDEAMELMLGGDSLDAVLENMAEQLKIEAFNAASLMNSQAKDGDVLRNHVNYGTMNQALRTLHHMGYDTMNATWGDGDMLICEKIAINGVTIYQREG